MTINDSAVGIAPQITLAVQGPVDAASRVAVEDEFQRLMQTAPRAVSSARIRLTVDELRLQPQQALAQGTLDFGGTVIRAEAAGGTATQAVDRLSDRLDRRLRAVAELDDVARPPTWAGWIDGGAVETRPDFFPLPPDQRKVVRRKTPALRAMAIEEAALTMELLDHRFFLFIDDGVDAIVFREGAGVSFRRVTGGDSPRGRPAGVGLTHASALELCLDEAASRTGDSDLPSIFFRQLGSARGAVLYRRYDGHYGLLAPASVGDPEEDRPPSW